MKKLLACLAVFGVLSCLVPTVPQVQGAAFLGNPDLLARACITNYTRVAPNICYVNTSPAASSGLTLDNTCRSVDFTAATVPIPSTAYMAIVDMNHIISTANTIAIRSLQGSLYRAATCLASMVTAGVQFKFAEWNATAAGTPHASIYQQVTVPITNGVMYYNISRTNCTAAECATSVRVMGYYD